MFTKGFSEILNKMTNNKRTVMEMPRKNLVAIFAIGLLLVMPAYPAHVDANGLFILSDTDQELQSEAQPTRLMVSVDLDLFYTSATIEGGLKAGTYDVYVGPEDSEVNVEGIVFTREGTALTGEEITGGLVEYSGELVGGRYEAEAGEDFTVKVTLENGEPVNDALVKWAGQEIKTDEFGYATLTAPKEPTEESVEVVKIYSTDGFERSAYGSSDYPVASVIL
jgi:hypothetical protein